MDLESVIALVAKSFHFNFTVVKPPFEGLSNFDSGLRNSLTPNYDFVSFGRELLEMMPEKTLILTVDEFNCTYAVVKSLENPDRIYVMGPIIRERITVQIEKRILRQFGHFALLRFMNIYEDLRIEYNSDARDFIVDLHSLAFPGTKIDRIRVRNFLPVQILHEELSEEAPVDDTSILEKIRLESLMISAVLAGDSKIAIEMAEKLETHIHTSGLQDPYLNIREQIMGLNKVCQYKLSQLSKVHPIYILDVYNTYSLKISEGKNLQKLMQLFRQMLISYCACIQNYSLEKYSPLIRRVISYIQLNYQEQLSLRQLAKHCHVNANYLSELFREETGMTLTAYINRYRVERSIPMLKYSEMRIAKISETIGFSDENYYSRIFKNQLGVSPKKYRQQHNE